MISRLPQFRMMARRFHTSALAELRRITSADDYEPWAYPLPPEDRAALPAKALGDFSLSVLPGCYVWAFSGSSSQPEGFEAQIIDLRHQAPFFQSPINWKNITGQGTVAGITQPLVILPQPRLVIDPGQLRVQIKNLSNNTNTVQLVVFTAEPK